MPIVADFDRIRRRATLAADLHLAGHAVASEAVGRDLAALGPAIARELNAAGRFDLAAAARRWERDLAAVDNLAPRAVSA